MNFFFGINNQIFKSQLQIPLFKNRLLKKSDMKLFKCYPYKNNWTVQEINQKYKINDYFYILNESQISNNEIFFLNSNDTIKKFNKKKLININNFTNTSPAYRANLQITLKNGGFSSYQSEYPYSMVGKKGSILSSINSLANCDAEKNYIFFKNIFEFPFEKKFDGYLVNYKLKKIEDKFEFKTNFTNFYEIRKEFIKPEIFFVTKEFLGIPMFVSVKDKNISFEHTHPPHEYILSDNRYDKIAELKREVNEIIN